MESQHTCCFKHTGLTNISDKTKKVCPGYEMIDSILNMLSFRRKQGILAVM